MEGMKENELEEKKRNGERREENKKRMEMSEWIRIRKEKRWEWMGKED